MLIGSLKRGCTFYVVGSDLEIIDVIQFSAILVAILVLEVPVLVLCCQVVFLGSFGVDISLWL
jgi:hypothetical protein